MQDDMRLTLPASGPEPKGAPAEVRVMLWDDGSEGGRGRCYVSLYAEPGHPLVIDPRDYVPKAQPEDERVMIRAVSPGWPGPDDDSDTWVLNPNATGHRAPFFAGDLVVEASGYRGIHQVVAVSVDPDAPTHRRLRLTVRRTDVVVDADEF
ncbi:hypothetical protein [Lichenibacterium ramalinae]|nr:hypothetical protein [Lichenibacterium ramalinae]